MAPGRLASRPLTRPRVEATIGVGAKPCAAAAASMWLADVNDASVIRIDPATGKTTHIAEIRSIPAWPAATCGCRRPASA
jgi:hypothetical protein